MDQAEGEANTSIDLLAEVNLTHRSYILGEEIPLHNFSKPLLSTPKLQQQECPCA